MNRRVYIGTYVHIITHMGTYLHMYVLTKYAHSNKGT